MTDFYKIEVRSHMKDRRDLGSDRAGLALGGKTWWRTRCRMRRAYLYRLESEELRPSIDGKVTRMRAPVDFVTATDTVLLEERTNKENG